MIIYIVSFLLTIVVLRFAEKVNNKTKYVLQLVAISIPSYIAGMRAVGVGVDTRIYGIVAYERSISGSLEELLKVYGSDSYLFFSVWYYLSKIFQDIFVPQFAVELIIELLLILALNECKKEESDFKVWLGMMVYYFVFYGYSLNIMRQSIALAMLLFGYKCLLTHKKYKLYIILNTIAVFIHTSAIFGVLIMIIYSIFVKFFYQNAKLRFAYISIAFASIGVFLLLYTRILSIIAKVIPRYAHYSSTEIKVSSTFNALALFAMVVFFILASRFFTCDKSKEFHFLHYLTAMGLPVFLINLYSNDTYRLSFYFLYCVILTAPHTLSCTLDKSMIAKKNSRILMRIFMIVLFCFWYIMFVKWGTNDIVPYTFK